MKKTKRILSILLSVMLVICATYVIPAQPTAAYSVKAEKLTLSTSANELVKGQTITLTVSAIKPTNASKDVTWKTSDSSVATVNEKGVVKAKATDFKVSGASSVNKDTMSMGTVVIKGEPGTTYTIEYNNKTYKISQPECRRIYPITL